MMYDCRRRCPWDTFIVFNFIQVIQKTMRLSICLLVLAVFSSLSGVIRCGDPSESIPGVIEVGTLWLLLFLLNDIQFIGVNAMKIIVLSIGLFIWPLPLNFADLNNFKSILNGRKSALIEFYAPWYVGSVWLGFSFVLTDWSNLCFVLFCFVLLCTHPFTIFSIIIILLHVQM